MLRAVLAEALGTALLLTVIVGSGIMGERLSGGNDALALLANAVATGAILFGLIVVFADLSGAHFNPLVTGMFALRGEIAPVLAAAYVAAQIAGAIGGVILAHAMFGAALIETSTHVRAGGAQLLSEAVATFGLLLFILSARRLGPVSVAGVVGLYIIAGYWFTASTAFANPAVTLARAMTDTFAGIAPASVPGFLAGQMAGALVALSVGMILFPRKAPT